MVLSETIKNQIRNFIQAAWPIGSHWSEAGWVDSAIAYMDAMKTDLSNVPKKSIRD